MKPPPVPTPAQAAAPSDEEAQRQSLWAPLRPALAYVVGYFGQPAAIARSRNWDARTRKALRDAVHMLELWLRRLLLWEAMLLPAPIIRIAAPRRRPPWAHLIPHRRRKAVKAEHPPAPPKRFIAYRTPESSSGSAPIEYPATRLIFITPRAPWREGFLHPTIKRFSPPPLPRRALSLIPGKAHAGPSERGGKRMRPHPLPQRGGLATLAARLEALVRAAAQPASIARRWRVRLAKTKIAAAALLTPWPPRNELYREFLPVHEAAQRALTQSPPIPP